MENVLFVFFIFIAYISAEAKIKKKRWILFLLIFISPFVFLVFRIVVDSEIYTFDFLPFLGLYLLSLLLGVISPSFMERFKKSINSGENISNDGPPEE